MHANIHDGPVHGTFGDLSMLSSGGKRVEGDVTYSCQATQTNTEKTTH
jgi:hypothetical protein